MCADKKQRIFLGFLQEANVPKSEKTITEIMGNEKKTNWKRKKENM